MLISIIIPTYNAARYINQAVESIINQTYKNFEIIVVDDGSTDNTKKQLKSYIEQNQIHYFYKKNGGVSSARNFGLENANGKYIAFLDADDLYHVNKLERQLAVLLSNPSIDIVYNDVILIDDDNKQVGILNSEEEIEDSANFFSEILYRQVIPASASMMLKRDFIDQGIRFPIEYRYAEDYSFILQLAENYNFYYLDEPLYYYRRHIGNLTNNHTLQMYHENSIVKSLGIHKIKQVVNKTTYTDNEKTILLAKILLKIGEYQTAISELNKVQIDDWEYYFIRGVIYYNLNDYYIAKESFLRSISIEESAESYNNLGCCLCKLNDEENALKYFTKASALRNLYNDPINNIKALKNSKDVKITEKKLRKMLIDYNS